MSGTLPPSEEIDRARLLQVITSEHELSLAFSWLFYMSGRDNIDDLILVVENRAREFIARDMLSRPALMRGLETFLYFNRLPAARQVLLRLERTERNAVTETVRSLIAGENSRPIEALYFLRHADYDNQQSLKPTTLAAIRQARLAAMSRILDGACGTGLAAPVLRQAGFGGHLVGVDLSPHMVSEARKKGCYDDLRVSDIGDFLAGSLDIFDAILLIGVVPHFDLATLRAVIGLAHARTRPAGLLLFDAPIAAAGGGGVAAAASQFGLHRSSLAQIEEVLAQAGFAIVSTSDEKDGATRQFTCRRLPGE